MSRARPNRSMTRLQVDPTLDLSPEQIRQGVESFDKWHWGFKPKKVVDWNDPDMPSMLVECGRCIRLHVRSPHLEGNPRRHPRRERDTMIQFSLVASENSHVAYDPNHPYERLYLLINPDVQPTIQGRFWNENNLRPMDLNQLAAIAGGHHGKRPDYPHIQVKPVGILTAVVYKTAKKGDSPETGSSYYIHKMAELSGSYPVLAADSHGRLWIAGGGYTSPPPGITD